jgi:hypothetical protein
MKKYTGGCHCGAVRYEVELELGEVLDCNCSHCNKKGFLLAFVDPDKFNLLKGEDSLTEYFFNKKSIHHLFCKVCGVQSFARGIVFPKVMINVRCLDDVDVSQLTVKQVDGKNF